MRPNNYDWLVPGVAINVYSPIGVKVDNFVLREKEQRPNKNKIYIYDHTNQPWSVGLRECQYYALPQDLTLLKNNKRWI